MIQYMNEIIIPSKFSFSIWFLFSSWYKSEVIETLVHQSMMNFHQKKVPLKSTVELSLKSTIEEYRHQPLLKSTVKELVYRFPRRQSTICSNISLQFIMLLDHCSLRHQSASTTINPWQNSRPSDILVNRFRRFKPLKSIQSSKILHEFITTEDRCAI